MRRLSPDDLQVMRQVLRRAAVDSSEEPELDERGLARTSAVVVGCEHCGEAAIGVCRSCGSREHVELRCPKCRCAVTALWVPSKAEGATTMSRARRTRRQLEDEVRRDIADLVGRALSNDKVALRVLRAIIAEVPAVLPIILSAGAVGGAAESRVAGQV